MRSVPRVSRLPLFFAALGLALLAAVRAAAAEETKAPIVILLSLDAFRADYLNRPEAANLRRLAAEGTRAEYMQSVFPSETFPNHYSIATGLRPAHHGIVSNKFYDPESGGVFLASQVKVSAQPRWWGGDPLWLTAKRQGLRTASVFWVGSDFLIKGDHPTYWQPYDKNLGFDKRLEKILGYLRLPETERPGLILFYMEDTDTYGHYNGPDSPELNAAIAREDKIVGGLLDGVKALGLEDRCYVLVVSDHGMSRFAPDQVVYLEDYVEPDSVIATLSGPMIAITPKAGLGVESLLARFPKEIRGARACRTADLPPEFHYGGTPRIAPLCLLADEGWRVEIRHGTKVDKVAQHGYDPRLESMHAIFLARGPKVRRGAVIPAFENIHVYNFVCTLLGVRPSPNDGDDRIGQASLVEQSGSISQAATGK